MFLLSIAGAAVAPLVVLVATYVNEPSTPFKELFYNFYLYTVLIIGGVLYRVVSTYFLNRGYVQNTIKYILTIPLSRVSFIMNKTLLLFMWIMMLTMIAWFLTLFLGLLTQFDGLDISLLVESFQE